MRLISFSIILLIFAHTEPTFARSEKVVPRFPTEGETLAAFRPLIGLKKDKFETSSDFTKRLCNSVENSSNSAAGSPTHFAVFDVTARPYYDADKKAFTVKILQAFPGAFDINLEKYLGVPIATSRKDKPSYIGKNAFGVTKDIVAEEADQVVLLLPVPKRTIEYSLVTKLFAEPDEARKLDNDLLVVVTTKVMSPCFVARTLRIPPTLESPEDNTYNMLGVVGEKDASWKIIKASTGEVLKAGKF